MAGTVSRCSGKPEAIRSTDNFAKIVAYVANLYCAGGSSSVSMFEAHELATSVAYVLGITDATPEEAATVLDVKDPIALWREGALALERRTDAVLDHVKCLRPLSRSSPFTLQDQLRLWFQVGAAFPASRMRSMAAKSTSSSVNSRAVCA